MSTLDSTPPLVLIASDQEWSGRSLETIIGPRGYAVVRAHTGQQVLETVRTTHVDLLILDTRLPDVDGILLCRQLREQRIVPATTPIILTTSVQATIGGSFSASIPQSATRAGEYRTAAGSRLSVTHDVRIESTVATVRPVSFRLIQSSTLRKVAVRS